jgi:hypothetical protein
MKWPACMDRFDMRPWAERLGHVRDREIEIFEDPR